MVVMLSACVVWEFDGVNDETGRARSSEVIAADVTKTAAFLPVLWKKKLFIWVAVATAGLSIAHSACSVLAFDKL